MTSLRDTIDSLLERAGKRLKTSNDESDDEAPCAAAAGDIVLDEDERLPRGMISYKDLKVVEKLYYQGIKTVFCGLQKSGRTPSYVLSVAEDFLRTTLEERPRLALVGSSQNDGDSCTCLLQELAFPPPSSDTVPEPPLWPKSRFFSPSKEFVLDVANALLLPVLDHPGLRCDNVGYPCLIQFANKDLQIYDWLAGEGRHILKMDYKTGVSVGALMSNEVLNLDEGLCYLGDQTTMFDIARNFFEKYPEGMSKQIQYSPEDCLRYPFERLVLSFDLDVDDRLSLAEWMLDQGPTTWLCKYDPSVNLVEELYTLILHDNCKWGVEYPVDRFCGLAKRILMHCPTMTLGVRWGIDSYLRYICRYKVSFDLVVTALRVMSVESPETPFFPAPGAESEPFEFAEAASRIEELVREEASLQQPLPTLRLAHARLSRLGSLEVPPSSMSYMGKVYDGFARPRCDDDATTRERIQEIRSELEQIREQVFAQSSANGLYDLENNSDFEGYN